MQNGTQRYIVTQTTKKSKRKAKRHSEKKAKSKLPLKERVFHILCTSKIKDFTHPKETDAYWDTIYKQYEHLCYCEIYYRQAISSSEKKFNKQEIIDITNTLIIIKKQKQLMLNFMINAMYVLYGSVMKKNFYGWFHYVDRFVSQFNETALTVIQSFKFDANRTRCSVYFYQTFWLSGIALKNEITKEIKQYYSQGDQNRGQKNMATFIDYTELFENVQENIDIDSYFYDEEIIEDVVASPIIENDNMEIEENIEEYEENKPKENLPINEITQEEITDKSIEEKHVRHDKYKLEDILDDILKQANLTRDTIFSVKNHNTIVTHIKRKINNGKIVLTSEQKKILRKYNFKV